MKNVLAIIGLAASINYMASACIKYGELKAAYKFGKHVDRIINEITKEEESE